jgi:glucans biosynthesis protein
MTDDPIHQRSSQPVSLRQARRCGAKTRTGQPCRSPAVRDRPRCRMHGCRRGAGGPQGERNGNYRHGRNTKETQAVVGRNVSTILRQPTVEFKLGFSAFSATAVRLD